MPDEKFRGCIFEIIVNNAVMEIFDTSHEFWKKPSKRNTKLKKKLRNFDVKHIGDAILVTLPVNPKEYIEVFNSKNVNKKHKGLKKDMQKEWNLKATQRLTL